jgi:hypothetical protein
VGRLVRANNPEQAVNAAYNRVDPVTSAGSSSWTSKYEYDASDQDLIGNITSQAYPGCHTPKYAYNASGRLKSFSGNLGDGVTRTYDYQMVYNAARQIPTEWF